MVRSGCGGSDGVGSEGSGGSGGGWWMSGTGIFGGGRLLGNYRKPNRVQSATVGKFGYTTAVSCRGCLQLCRRGLVERGGSSGRVRVCEVWEYKGFQPPLYSVIYSAYNQVLS
ncbi:unnamed protein product [Macrosiphum euphorbiae]|uniref:Uncharacterized protein n=1 Tax=Macrosiphum euphorbiae TaxID=13131 RepID=A0AAV0WKJ5_9HEMI|nr:unnamed protein product [Macrosiphum euphorbiae]